MPAPFTPSPFAAPATAQRQPQLLPARQQEQEQIVAALIAMSFPPEAARQAVLLSGATDLETAMAVLLGEPLPPPAAGPPPATVMPQQSDQMMGQEEARTHAPPHHNDYMYQGVFCF